MINNKKHRSKYNKKNYGGSVPKRRVHGNESRDEYIFRANTLKISFCQIDSTYTQLIVISKIDVILHPWTELAF